MDTASPTAAPGTKKSRRWRRLASRIAGMAVVEMALLPMLACDPFDAEFEDVEDAIHYRAADIEPAPERVDRVEVMTYNIKFGGGRITFFFECGGERVLMEEDEVVENMEGLAHKLEVADPDVVILQEIDINSKRAAFVDQVQWLLDHTSYNYGVYASQWRADHVPSDGIGAVDSGTAILTRWPISQAERLALPLIGDQDALTQYFYLKRNILRARIDIPGTDGLWVLGTHLAAFSQDGTKKRQLDRLLAELDRLSERGELVVAGGDLNTVPPRSEKRQDFIDACEEEVEEEFEGDDFTDEIGWLDPFYERYTPAVSLDEYEENNEAYFTYTGKPEVGWARKLDYIFTNATIVDGSTITHQGPQTGGVETLSLSDHAPVSTVLELR
jgi:endonuclease/exonuclease/phosphatase family metal-dependent hydrolase